MSTSPGSSSLPRGILPILSGPPPVVESTTCRQCGKSFNPVWRRAKTCGHCGYEYCSSCISDGQALMPRRPDQQSPNAGPLSVLREELGLNDRRNVMNGYQVESVCLPCLGMLQVPLVTAAPLQMLRSLPLKRLKEYLAAYDIPCLGPSEKEDFVQAVVKARDPHTGCLPPEAESYYRRKSVPKAAGDTSSNNSTPQAHPPPPYNTRSQARPPPPPGSGYRPPPPQANGNIRPTGVPRPAPQQYARPPPPRPAAPRPPPTSNAPRTSAGPSKNDKVPEPPVPSIASLVSLPKSYLSSLSIGTLKAILFENHVKVDFKQVLEKTELINRVSELIVDERKRLERQARAEEAEANGLAPDRMSTDTPGSHEGDVDRKVPTGPMPEIDRGLCVVCQDAEATLAVVDCGHLAMCGPCSDLIMATSQECPLCRTRIVTPQRLIRIYRT